MNTAEMVRVFKEVGIKDDDAIEISETIRGRSGLATKEDIHLLKEDLTKTEHILRQEIVEVKNQVNKIDKKVSGMNKDITWLKVIGIGIFIAIIVNYFIK